jgi:hypothetical protein
MINQVQVYQSNLTALIFMHFTWSELLIFHSIYCMYRCITYWLLTCCLFPLVHVNDHILGSLIRS